MMNSSKSLMRVAASASASIGTFVRALAVVTGIALAYKALKFAKRGGTGPSPREENADIFGSGMPFGSGAPCELITVTKDRNEGKHRSLGFKKNDEIFKTHWLALKMRPIPMCMLRDSCM